MSHDNMVGWCTLFLTIVGKEAPTNVLDEDLDERERNHWWKGKKWAYANLNRLFVRYVIIAESSICLPSANDIVAKDTAIRVRTQRTAPLIL